MCVETAAVSGVTGCAAELFHFEHDSVAVAVNGDIFDKLHVAAALALAPEFIAAA